MKSWNGYWDPDQNDWRQNRAPRIPSSLPPRMDNGGSSGSYFGGDVTSNHRKLNKKGLGIGGAALALLLIATPLGVSLKNSYESGKNYAGAAIKKVGYDNNLPKPILSSAEFSPVSGKGGKVDGLASYTIQKVQQRPTSKLFEVGIKVTITDKTEFKKVTGIDATKLDPDKYFRVMALANDPKVTAACYNDLYKVAQTAIDHAALYQPDVNGSQKPRELLQQSEVVYGINPFTTVPDDPNRYNTVVGLTDEKGAIFGDFVDPNKIC